MIIIVFSKHRDRHSCCLWCSNLIPRMGDNDNGRAADLPIGVSRNRFSKGIMTVHTRFPPKTLRELCGLAVVEPAKDAMAI